MEAYFGAYEASYLGVEEFVHETDLDDKEVLGE